MLSMVLSLSKGRGRNVSYNKLMPLRQFGAYIVSNGYVR